jgi:hypothetical protein
LLCADWLGAAAGRELVGKGSTWVTASAPSICVGPSYAQSAIVAGTPVGNEWSQWALG